MGKEGKRGEKEEEEEERRYGLSVSSTLGIGTQRGRRKTTDKNTNDKKGGPRKLALEGC